MIRDFESLENWELRIIEGIKNDPKLSLALVIGDGRNPSDLERLTSFEISKTIQSVGKIIFKWQERKEKERYLKNMLSIERKEVIFFLNNIPNVKLYPIREANTDHFSKEDADLIKEYNLDLILKMNFANLKGAILSEPKLGIWNLIHSENSLKRGGFPGFWEVLNKEPFVTVSLFKLNLEGDGLLIDRAYFNRNPTSAIITNNIVKESSVSLLLKYLNNTECTTSQQYEKPVDLQLIYRNPGLFYIGNYLWNFYSNYTLGKLKRFFESKDKRTQCWTLFLGKGNFLDADLKSISPVNLPKDEFWADPFLFEYEDNQYVFFENYSYKTEKGKISCGKVKDDKLVEITDVLDLPYHLSYPYIFEENGVVYMMPETSENKRLEIFRCQNFPDQWEICTTAFEGEQVVDASFYEDEQSKKWLFLNKIVAPNVDRTSELHIYLVDSIKLNELLPHKQNPVIIDSRIARNGGAIFINGEHVFRPSQRNTDGMYGKALNINKVKKLTIEEYEEEIYQVVDASFNEEFISIHHLHQTKGTFVFDAAYADV